MAADNLGGSMSKDILLFSGGLDSLIAWYYLNEPKCLYVNLGHKYNIKERIATDSISKAVGMDLTVDNRLSMGDFEREDAYIPMRNSFLAHIASLYGDKIWIVAQKGEMDIPDRSPKFFNEITDLLKFLNGNLNIQVSTPFSDMTKTDMVSWYVEQGLPIDILKLTSSCYNGDRCGTCPACFRRWVSMELNSISEYYKVNPWETPLAQVYAQRAKEGYYNYQRTDEILLALKRKGVIS
jgi:7-cyano-7-deazaguanine synthase in queuosine biosynthesis